jgi:FAD/FMN-containing dehydrogenase/Fe-S oxidoreductase
MDLSPSRLRDDLKGLVRGELLFDDLSRALYSTDASLFEVMPAGVVVPRDEDDVCAVVKYAGEHQVPLTPRGAGTGVAGAALGPGLVLDLSKHFRGIGDIGADTVRVQAGVIHRDLARALARVGRRFAPDPAHGECTVGGMLGNNASGARAYRHGYTRDHVVAVRVVLDSGDVVEAVRRSRWPEAEGEGGRLDDIVSATVTLLEQHADLIDRHRPKVHFDRCGYLLHDVLGPEELDLPRLLIGSEGTLALFTEATLATVPLPGGRSVALLGFDTIDGALKGARAALDDGPVGCDLIDRRLLRLAGGEGSLAALVPAATEAVLLIEFEADSPAAARAAARGLVERLHRRERRTLFALSAWEEANMERLRQVREAALPGLYGLRGPAQPLAFVEDVAVPPEALPEYLHRIQTILQRHEVTATFLLHTATGQVDMRPFLAPQSRTDRTRMWDLAEEVYGVVLELGGTISSRHAVGLARTPWVARQAGPLYPVWRELKSIFDPRYVFNPGKIVGPAAGAPGWPLRRAELRPEPAPGHTDADARERPADAGPQLRWPPGQIAAECLACNGCGHCRTTEPPRRMCPIFRVSGDEAATPRAKANLMAHLLQPDADPRLLAAADVRAVADLCVNCKMCAHECPAHVNVPKLMLEAKAAHVARHGLDRGDWVLARTESFAHLGSILAPLVNGLLDNDIARWLMEKLFGVSRKRRLPGFAENSFLRLAHRRGWTRKPRSARPRVAYFIDVFANYNDPTIAEAVVAVLHHNGIEVYVPPGQMGCGMAPLAMGDAESARETVQHNLRLLADLAREGYPILCSEPTAALMLRHDALDLIDDADARLVAAQTVELTAFLWDLHRQGLMRSDFSPLEIAIGHHVPCHLKALGRPAAGPSLLALVPGLRVRTLDVGCSGMAGTYGLKADNYATSLAAGAPMLRELSCPELTYGSTECSTCRLQMEDGAGKRTLHPVQYLALAYGLLPEVRQRLTRRLGKRVLR